MSSVSPRPQPRSAGRFYATAVEVVEAVGAVNDLILAHRVVTGTEELAVTAAESGAVGKAGGPGKFEEVVTQLLEVEHLVAEELGRRGDLLKTIL